MTTTIDRSTSVIHEAGPARERRIVRPDVLVPGLAMVALIPLYVALAVRNNEQLKTSGYDLGIFMQEVKAYSELHAPVSPLLGTDFSTLGDHFSPLMSVLAPFYALFPSTTTLLVAQAVLFAIGVIPLSRWAVRSLGTTAGVVVALAYGLSWGVQAALNFDFHEIALAVPLLAFSVSALGQRQWNAALLWALPLVFVKEDLGLTVLVIGGMVAFLTSGRTRVLGILTGAWGIGWTVLAVTVIVPALSPTGSYGQGSKLGSAGAGGALDSAAHGVFGGDVRDSTMFLLLLITGFAALRSPLTLIAAPTLAWRFVSENSSFWGPIFHYSAVLMPIMFAALIDALVRGRANGHITPRARRTILATVAVVALGAAPFLPLDRLLHAETWRTDPQVEAIPTLTADIPDGDSIGASNNLVPQLVPNYDVSIFPALPTFHERPDWLMVDRARPPNWPKDSTGDRHAIDDALANGYTKWTELDGIVLLRNSHPT